MSTEPTKPGEKHSECKLVVYVSRQLLDEVEKRARLLADENETYSKSRVVRQALRDAFRRNPVR